MEVDLSNLFLIGSFVLFYYLYNYKNPNKISHKNNLVESSKKKKKKSQNEFHSRMSNLPNIEEKRVRSISGKSIGDYLKYFKQFNKPVVREIKQNIHRFDKLKHKIANNPNNVYLIQELDNLEFLKKTIIEGVNSLIYSIDIENCETEKNYNLFNIKISEKLNKDLLFLKHNENKKNKDKNTEADINIYSGISITDGEVLPFNY